MNFPFYPQGDKQGEINREAERFVRNKSLGPAEEDEDEGEGPEADEEEDGGPGEQ